MLWSFEIAAEVFLRKTCEVVARAGGPLRSLELAMGLGATFIDAAGSSSARADTGGSLSIIWLRWKKPPFDRGSPERSLFL